MYLLAKYNTQTTIYFTIVKRGVVDLAATADWTPATGDTKISKDGGNVANTTNNPAAVGGTGSVLWSLTLTATELSAADVEVQIVDSATKAVEDQLIRVYTYGNASAKYVSDFSVAALGAVMPTTAGRTLDVSAGGEAGLDWANIGSPTTTVNLSGTSTKALEPTTAGRTLDVTTTGEAGLDFANLNLPAGAIPALGIVDNGTAQSATGTTLVLRSAAAFADSELIGATVLITGGTTGVGQARVITANVGSTDTVTVDTWTTTPTGTITYIVFGGSPASTSLVPTVDVVKWNNTAVSTPAIAGIPDINVKNINNVVAATPGASGGILISGSNSGTTTLGAFTVTGTTTHTGATVHTGNVSMAAGLNITQSTANTTALVVTGNGTGNGATITSGSGATGQALNLTSAATNGSALVMTAAGTGSGISSSGGASGKGALLIAGATGSAALALQGGSTSGVALSLTTTAGDGIQILPTAGNGVTITANGTSKHGIVSTGGTAGTSDGIKAVAGTGGVDIRGAITGNITGTTSTSAVSYQKNVAANDIPFTMVDSTDHVTRKTGLTITATRSIDGGSFASATGTVAEVGNGIYVIDASQADMNGNNIVFRFTGTAADPVELHIKTYT